MIGEKIYLCVVESQKRKGVLGEAKESNSKEVALVARWKRTRKKKDILESATSHFLEVAQSAVQRLDGRKRQRKKGKKEENEETPSHSLLVD